MSINIVQHFFYILYRLIYGFLLSNNLFLSTCSQHRSLLYHLHHFLLITFRHYLFLFVIESKLELTRISLNFITNRLFLFLLLIWVVVVFNHQINASIQIVHQLLAIIEVESDKEQTMLHCQHLTLTANHIHMLLRVVHFDQNPEGIVHIRCEFY